MLTLPDLNEEEIEKTEAYKNFLANCRMFPSGFVRFYPGGCVLPPCYKDFHESLRGFQLREDDIWVASFPKSGTTWTQEMVWNIINDVDLETAKTVNVDHRAPFLELTGILEYTMAARSSGADKQHIAEKPAMFDSLGLVSSLSLDKPRVIKTHLPVELMPKEVLEKHKIIYVSRNPRDVVLSFYNHWRLLQVYTGDFAGFFDAFLEGCSGYYCPFFSHNINYWNIREQKNILFLFYEDMQKDLRGIITQVCNFIGKQLSQKQIEDLHDHLEFDKMKNNPAVNKEKEIDARRKTLGLNDQAQGRFMNKGKSGSWRTGLTADQISRIQEWENEYLKPTDLRFQYD